VLSFISGYMTAIPASKSSIKVIRIKLYTGKMRKLAISVKKALCDTGIA